VSRTRRPSTDPRRAVGYLRCSTSDQALSPAAQRAALEAWATREGVALVAVLEDVGVSGGAPVEDRPGLLAAMAALEEHGAGLLVVVRRDRLARDVMVAAVADRLVERVGARVVSVAGEGNGDDAASLLMRQIVDAFASYERALIRQRTRAALAVKRERGEVVGTAPLGFRAVRQGDAPARLVRDERETEALALIRELRAGGLSLRQIARELEARGINTRGGSKWSAEAVNRALRAA
jgi:DNA invertase Pin-like site-specific DNA recombinase